jgi:hypothetical protein
MRWLVDTNKVVVANGLDYGCGRGFDATHFGMTKYDPHFYPEYPVPAFSVITCIYVLNVVGIDSGRNIIKQIQSLLVETGSAYVVWRNDLRRDTDSQRRVAVTGGTLLKQTRPYHVARINKYDKVVVT